MVGQFMRRRKYEENENENDANMCAFDLGTSTYII